jgi:hypothetical protein
MSSLERKANIIWTMMCSFPAVRLLLEVYDLFDYYERKLR